MRTTVYGIDITVSGLYGVVKVGAGNVFSAHAVALRGDLTALSLDLFSCNDGFTKPVGKSALGTITSSAEMTADIPCDGFGYVMWYISTAGSTAGSLINLEFDIKQTVPA